MARTRQIEVVLSAVEEVTENLIKRLTLDIVAELVKAPSEGGTPIDTGWASANWFPGLSISRRDGNVLDPDSGDVAEAQGAQQAGIVKVLAYKLGRPVYITNNVPYITRLNDGHSQQAPKGFVQAAITRAFLGL
jgi:hypothetical protein